MSQINNAYIDELHIVAGSDSNNRFNNGTPYGQFNLIGEKTPSNRITFDGWNGIANTGYQWVMQITNSLSSSITFDSTDYLEILTVDYWEDEGACYFYPLKNITLPGEASLYIGSNNLLNNSSYVPASIPASRKIKQLFLSSTSSVAFVNGNVSTLTIPLESDSGYISDYLHTGNVAQNTAFALISTTSTGTPAQKIVSDVIGQIDRAPNILTMANISAVFQALTWFDEGEAWNPTLGGSGGYAYSATVSSSIRRNPPAPISDGQSLAGINDTIAPVNSRTQWNQYWAGSGTYDWDTRWRGSDTPGENNLRASAAGDPHIITVNEEYYKFDYLGAFRLYEDDDLIINGLSELGDATRWEDKQYIRKVFIQYQDKSILIDTGFRGTPAKILENNGFEYTDGELEFNQLAEVNCWQCRKTYNILEKGFINRHRNKYGHKILDPIRNKITIELENFKFEIFNVNEYNLQPCRFNFSKLDNDYSKSKGCLIERKYVGVSILEDIKDIDKMVEIDEKNNNDLVEQYSTVEMNVELIDPKFI